MLLAEVVLSEYNLKKTKQKHDFDFGLFCYLHTEAQIRTYAAHSTQMKLKYFVLLAAPRVFNHANSDYIHKHTVLFRNDCHVRQR